MVRANEPSRMIARLSRVLVAALGVLTLYLALFVATLAASEAVIRHRLLARALGHPVGFDDYLRLALLVAALATIGARSAR